MRGRRCIVVAMSRKREKAKESKRELARQLGVPVDEVPDTLREHARVSAPTLRPTLHVVQDGRGLLRRAGPVAVHLALYLVDSSGARSVRRQTLAGAPPKKIPGDAVLSLVTGSDEATRVTYARPAHFLLVALVTEGATDEERLAHGDAVADASGLRIRVGSDSYAPGATAFAADRFERPHVVELHRGAGQSPIAGAVRAAAAILSLPGVHRAKERVDLDARSPDGKLVVRLSVDVRV